MEKVLVCITPQSNSHRLIDRAAAEAEASEGELHVLHVHKGGNIFFSEDSGRLLEELFGYGTKKGGYIHALAGDDVPELINTFASKHKITKLIVGEPPRGAPVSAVIEALSCSLNGVEIIVLERES